MEYTKNCYYHLYNRGCNQEPIFRDENDFQKLYEIIKKSKIGEYLDLIAFSFKSTHYHFFVKQISDKSVTDWIKYIFIVYSKYFNKKYKRSGTIFEGKVKSKFIDKEEYLFIMPHYIHSNPSNKLEEIYSSLALIWKDEIISSGFYKEHYLSLDEYYRSLEDYKNSIETKNKLEKYLYKK